MSMHDYLCIRAKAAGLLVGPEIAEPIGCQLRIQAGMRSLPMPQIGLNSAGIVALGGQVEARGVPRHMWMCSPSALVGQKGGIKQESDLTHRN